MFVNTSGLECDSHQKVDHDGTGALNDGGRKELAHSVSGDRESDSNPVLKANGENTADDADGTTRCSTPLFEPNGGGKILIRDLR